MQRETFGNPCQSCAYFGHKIGRYRGLAALIIFAAFIKMRPTAIQPVSFVGLVIFPRFKLVIHARLKCGLHILNFALGDQPVLDQPFGIQRKRGFLAFDFIVHDRVGEHRLIAFVMPKPAVAEYINDHIFVEFLAKFGGHFGRMNHGFGIITVDVEYGRFDHQSNIGGIRR